ncbi:hypothetical protein SCTVLC_2284 [Serratia symbiotica SCt-VLC]|uniref:Uncharacterized protein n=1 Tax=Serratia symbiotica SCt-VLC TaxID=1347341 RepID=A0A068RDC6_9GAMM|nr:hypothetical protein SCTVLC_2284 [Serratia symbiotica SCt-VLC]
MANEEGRLIRLFSLDGCTVGKIKHSRLCLTATKLYRGTTVAVSK